MLWDSLAVVAALFVAGVAIVLMIACDNIAILLLAGGAWLRWRGMPSTAWDALASTDHFEVFSLQPDDIDGDLNRFHALGKISP